MISAARLREGVVGDVDAVLALERATAEAPHWAKGTYQRLVEGPECQLARRFFTIAEQDGELVGFAIGRVVADLAELESVVVGEAARRLGLGGRLCTGFLLWCRTRGALRVELEVRAGSAGAVRLYRRLGLREVGRRRGYYSAPVEDAVLMRLELENAGGG